MAEKKETKEEAVVEKVDVDAFIARKLRDINDLEDDAKAKFLAERVLDNKRGKK